jgi:hypothetical protein
MMIGSLDCTPPPRRARPAADGGALLRADAALLNAGMRTLVTTPLLEPSGHRCSAAAGRCESCSPAAAATGRCGCSEDDEEPELDAELDDAES